MSSKRKTGTRDRIGPHREWRHSAAALVDRRPRLRVTYLLVWSLRMPPLRELWLGSLLFAFLGAVLFMIAAMDYPFRGKVRIGPEAFKAVYRRM